MDLSHGQAVIRLKDIRAELEQLGQRDDLTVEDEKRFDELTREFAEVDDHRRQMERTSALERVRSAVKSTERLPSALRVERGTSVNTSDGYDLDPVLNPDSVEDKRFRNPWDLSEVRTFGRSKAEVGQELRSRALSAIEKMSGANDAIRATGTDIVEMWDDDNASISRMCLATSSPEYLRAWAKMARGNGHMVTPDEQRALERAMSLTDSSGGYLVPFQLDPTVIITSAGSLNEIRRVARQVVATGDVWNGVSAGQVNWSWAAEAAEATDDSPSFAQPTVPVYKAHGFVPISIEALQDEANVTSEVGRLLAFGKDALEAQAFITGTGTGQPTGLAAALGAPQQVNAATDNALVADDVYKLDNALPARYRGASSWLAHRSIYNLIRKLGTGGGSDMWERIGNDVPAMLLGRPAYEAEAMESVSTLGATMIDKALIYGDFSNYVIADRVGFTVELLPHLVGANRRPTGQRGWYAYYRVGANSVNSDGFRVLML
jgi:HK97 family phage major capsid protein